MQAGISTACFYPQYTEQALRYLMDHEVPAAELFINCAEELTDAYCTMLARESRGAGTNILSLHPYTCGMEPMYFFSEYDRRFAEGVEIYKRYFHAASLLGAGIVVFHGDIKRQTPNYSLYFERFERLWQVARSFGTELCQENVERCASHSVDFYREMARQLPQAGYVLDVKQAVRSGVDPFVLAAVMGSKIRHIHISSHDKKNDCLPIGKGVFNTQKFLSQLDQNGFSGGLVVELYRENYGKPRELINSCQLLQGYISTLHKTC